MTDVSSEDRMFVDAGAVTKEALIAKAMVVSRTRDTTEGKDTSDTLVIADSQSGAGDDIHWFITASAGQSKVLDTIVIPSNSGIEDIDIDSKGTSYSLGAGIHYLSFSFILSYTNLGEAGTKISAASLNRVSFEQGILDTAPKLVDGLSVEAQYTLWSNDVFTAAVGVGLLAWQLDYSRQLQGGPVRVSEQGVNVLYQASLAYQLGAHMQVTLKLANYQLALNKVNNVFFGVRYNF
jgi:hypothetical protein